MRRTRRGQFDLRIPAQEREILRSLPGQLRTLLGTGDPDLRRLFPPAYADDPGRDAEYRGMVGEDLLASRRRSLEIMESTIDAERLDEEQMLAWLGAINDLRLVLGTRLDVTEESYERPVEPGDQDAPAFAVFAYLGWLEEQVVEALSFGLDP